MALMTCGLPRGLLSEHPCRVTVQFHWSCQSWHPPSDMKATTENLQQTHLLPFALVSFHILIHLWGSIVKCGREPWRIPILLHLPLQFVCTCLNWHPCAVEGKWEQHLLPFQSGFPSFLPLHSITAPSSPHFTLTGSQDLNALRQQKSLNSFLKHQSQTITQIASVRHVCSWQNDGNQTVHSDTESNSSANCRLSSNIIQQGVNQLDSTPSLLGWYKTLLGDEPGSPWLKVNTSHYILNMVAPRFSHVGIVPDNGAGQQIFSGISSFPHPFIPALLHTHLISPSLALKTSLLSAAQISLIKIDTTATGTDEAYSEKKVKPDGPATHFPDFGANSCIQSQPASTLELSEIHLLLEKLILVVPLFGEGALLERYGSASEEKGSRLCAAKGRLWKGRKTRQSQQKQVSFWLTCSVCQGEPNHYTPNKQVESLPQSPCCFVALFSFSTPTCVLVTFVVSSHHGLNLDPGYRPSVLLLADPTETFFSNPTRYVVLV
ncbi:hypothetical protein PR048_031653 [Dryococelus australis]|uniref:Uncharacterized protein n=1 Tax=Dryococelus australis TaxID=614101 RepID=A0ABQ9G5W2_9NEOP|nr:hypothetical protein PR048_031653 [Dryococelus australis]